MTLLSYAGTYFALLTLFLCANRRFWDLQQAIYTDECEDDDRAQMRFVNEWHKTRAKHCKN